MYLASSYVYNIKGDRMKHNKSSKPVLLILVVLSLVGLLGLNIIKNNAYIEAIDGNFYGFFSMLRYSLIENPIRSVSNMSNDVATSWQLRQENDALRTQLEASAHLETLYYELQNEVQELKALNEMSELYSDFKMMNTTISTRSVESWDNTLTIGIGSADGVQVDDGVISAKGIIGRVIQVSENQSTVNLLTANNEYSQVAIQIQIDKNTWVSGILTGFDYNQNLFKVELLESSASVTEGMLVSTSGMGGIFPSGFKVGEVSKVENVADGIGVVIYVKSNVDFDSLQYVAVVQKP